MRMTGRLGDRANRSPTGGQPQDTAYSKPFLNTLILSTI